MNFKFDEIIGPYNSKNQNFEELIGQILSVEINAIPIDGSGGDLGIDCFSNQKKGELEIYQAKYFTSRLTKGQKRQIKDSLSVASNNHDLTKWILCIPINQTPKELEWFNSLKSSAFKIEWWGATIIRQLLAKYPHITKSFFREDALISAFEHFKKEIRITTQSFYSLQHINYKISKDETTPSKYLNWILDNTKYLKLDYVMFQKQIPQIAIDSCDIYRYLTSDPNLVLSTPIIDFCIEKSPIPFLLLPGAASELKEIINYSYRQQRIGMGRINEMNENLLQNFVSAYEKAPHSLATNNSYMQIMDYVKDTKHSNYRPPVPIRFEKLEAFIKKSEQCNECEIAKIENGESSDLYKIINLFNQRRNIYNKHHVAMNNYFDAINMSIVKNLFQKNNNQILMISSARSFHSIGEELFNKNSPLRSVPEFAYVIWALQLSNDSIILNQQAETKSFLETVNITDNILSNYDKILSSFKNFAPLYREFYRPIDEMIESEALLAPKYPKYNMKELYDILAGESDLVKSFKRWWDAKVEELRAIDEIMKEKYNYGKLEVKINKLKSINE